MTVGSCASSRTPAAMATPPDGSSPAASRSAKPGSQTQSSLTSTIASDEATAAARLTAFEKPWLLARRITSTSGKRRARRSAVSSVEPLSTTTTSELAPSDGSSRSSRRAPFQLGTITVALTPRATPDPRASIGPASPQDGHDRQGEDVQVATDRDVLDVVALDGEPLVEPKGAAPVDLHRPRHPRLDRHRETLLGRVLLADPYLLGARADEAHLGAEDVDELGQLVEARPAQQAPDRGHARVVAELERRLLELADVDELSQPL